MTTTVENGESIRQANYFDARLALVACINKYAAAKGSADKEEVAAAAFAARVQARIYQECLSALTG